MKKSAPAWVFLILGMFLFMELILIARPFLLAVVAGGMMALVLSPFYFQLSLKFNKFGAAFVATALMVLVVVLPMLGLAVVALKDANTLVTQLMSDSSSSSIKQWWTEIVPKVASIVPFVEITDVEQHALVFGKLVLDWSSRLVFRLASEIPELLLQLTLGTLSCYFLLLDGSKFISFAKNLLPLPTEIHHEIYQAFRDATRATLFSSLAAAVVQACIVALTFALMKIPSVALAAGATFIFAWVPVVGSVPVFLGAGLWLASCGAWGKLLAIIVAAGVTGIADNLVRPFILKGANDMHPLVSLIAILGGIELFGLLGVMIGPVLVAIFLACARVWPAVAKAAGWMGTSTVEAL
jgi:predicted PurR-regulated permease PerM